MSWVQKFRERPRAVVIFPCAEAAMNALSCDLRDARHWIGEGTGVFSVVAVLQGRVHEGDWIRCTVTRQRRLCWSINQPIPRLLSDSNAQIRFVLDSGDLPERGWYDLQVECNGRLAGKARLEVL